MPLVGVPGGQPGTVSDEGEFLLPSCAARSPRPMALGAPASTRHQQRTAQVVNRLNLPTAGHARVTDKELLLLLS